MSLPPALNTEQTRARYGLTLNQLAKRRGHDVVTMEKHYARWIEGREDADREQLGRIYG